MMINPDQQEIGVSVIICCYNSAARLPDTLKHLSEQQVSPGINWEIILVDNASTDNTSASALNEWEKYQSKTPFRLLLQPMPGKNHAYKKGVTSARYEFILTCDDDNRLSPDYIETAFNLMFEDPSIGVLGGAGIFDPEQPVTEIAERYHRSYVNGSQSWAINEHWVYGAGSICRKSVLMVFYSHDWEPVTSGRTGVKLISGEDVEICFMFYLSGYKILADDKLTFLHYVPLERQTLDYLLKLKYWISYSYVLLNSYVMLLEGDQRNVAKKLDKWLLHQMRALLSLFRQTWRLRLFFRTPDVEYLLQKQSYLAGIKSIYQNRAMLEAHLNNLKSTLIRSAKQNDR